MEGWGGSKWLCFKKMGNGERELPNCVKMRRHWQSNQNLPETLPQLQWGSFTISLVSLLQAKTHTPHTCSTHTHTSIIYFYYSFFKFTRYNPVSSEVSSNACFSLILTSLQDLIDIRWKLETQMKVSQWRVRLVEKGADASSSWNNGNSAGSPESTFSFLRKLVQLNFAHWL